MKKIQKIVLKYTNPDPYWVENGMLYVGMNHPCNEIKCSEWPSVEAAINHSNITSEPTEVKILTFSIEESNP